MKRNWIRVASLALAVALLVCSFAACKSNNKKTTTPLVVGYAEFSGKFSPFFSDTQYDKDATDMTQVMLMTTDRAGGIVYKAIEGEKKTYNGKEYTYKGISDITVTKNKDTTVYDVKIRDDIKFSDGVKMTADDIIFTYYVLSDTAYDGSYTFYSTPIQGMKNYRTQTTDAIYKKYAQFADDIQAAGATHKWAATDAWTKDVQDSYYKIQKRYWLADVEGIVNTCLSQYLTDDLAKSIGKTAKEITDNKNLQVAFGMAAWNYGSLKNGKFVAPSGKSWTLKDSDVPTLEDFYNETYTAYKGDAATFYDKEDAGSVMGSSVVASTKEAFISEIGSKDSSMSKDGVPNISGIKKISDTEVQVTTDGFDATAIYNIFGMEVCPLHYYGDTAKYDYAKNQFGFTRGDLTAAKAKTDKPLGAGPYTFEKFENKVIYFKANESYYEGAPKIQNIQFKVTTEADKISGVSTGTIDLTDPSGSKERFQEIKDLNSNKKLSGDTIMTSTVDNLGYGYMGINADTVKVGSDSGSAASKALRKAFATIFAVYRDEVIDSYYGEAASVINYPMSLTSWAAPQKSDAGYRVAYSVDADGKDLYTSGMKTEDKYAAAKTGALSLFKAAGYTVKDGKVTAAPTGAKMEYEIMIPGDGKGDHPAFGILTYAKKALAEIGIKLNVKDLTDSSVMWEVLDANKQEMWVAAWQATIDPDLYQVYHSSNIVGKGGSDSNHYHITSAKLDQLIMDARSTDDQAYRTKTYKSCLDEIMDWGVEIPIYQRQNCIIFSAKRINTDTVTPDITPYWTWLNGVATMEMNDSAAK